MMVITSKDNPRIKELAKLFSSRKYRRETGLFVIEGLRGCADAVRDAAVYHQLSVTAVFFVKEAVEKSGEVFPEELLMQLGEDKCFEITEQLAQRISDTGSCQGIFAVAKRVDKPFEGENISQTGRYIVLDDLQDPGNLGTVIRTADAMGVDGVVLAGDCVDLYNPKTVRSAVGSLPRLDIFIEKDFERVTRVLKRRGVTTYAAVISGGEEVTKAGFQRGCAVVIGNEGRGLSDRDADLCDRRVTIAMKGHINSLNAATAAAILLWEMMREQ